MSRKGKSIETKSRLVGTRDWGRERWKVAANGRVSFWYDENVLELDSDDIDLFTQ